MIFTICFHFQMADDARVFEIIYKNEKVADKILSNKQELVDWDKKRQGNREALRELRKSEDKKCCIIVGSMLVQMERLKAIDVLTKGKTLNVNFKRISKNFFIQVEQVEIEKEISKLRDEQLILVKEHKDLEMDKMPSGFDLKPMNRKEINVLKNELKL